MNFGPIYSPDPTADLPILDAREMLGNAVESAIDRAINPPPAEVKAAEQRQEAKQKEEREQREERDAVALKAAGLKTALEVDPRLTTVSKADASVTIGRLQADSTLGTDLDEVSDAGAVLNIRAALHRMAERNDTEPQIAIKGLDGYAPEISLKGLGETGVIRLSYQSDRPEAPITEMPNGELGVRVRLDYSDGRHTNTEMRFRRAA